MQTPAGKLVREEEKEKEEDGHQTVLRDVEGRPESSKSHLLKDWRKKVILETLAVFQGSGTIEA